MGNARFDAMVQANPDSFDYGDCPDDRHLSQAYRDAVTPDWVKTKIEERRVAHEKNAQKNRSDAKGESKDSDPSTT